MSRPRMLSPADTVDTFGAPTALPQNEIEAKRWQEANRSWWEDNPMRYDWRNRIEPEEFTHEFYADIDGRFFTALRAMMPWSARPLDSLIDYSALRNMDALEIGVGCGSHAQLLATYAKSFTGIDLTRYAVDATTRRLDCFGIDGTIICMDAETMEFEDDSFDFIWSWGVVHHSSNTLNILKEMRRVLRPGGKAIVMVYHLSWWVKYFIAGLVFGCLHGELMRGKSLHRIIQDHTDGAIARYYTVAQWRRLTAGLFDVTDIRICGQKELLIPLPGGRLKRGVSFLLPDMLGRFLASRCRMGNCLVSVLQKTAGE